MHFGILETRKRVSFFVLIPLGFAETTSNYNGLFFSIFQFTGCVGTLLCGLIRLIFPGVNNNVIFSILTVASVLASVYLLFLPPVQSYESQSSNNESLSVNIGLFNDF